MTNVDVARLRELEAAATRGPWKASAFGTAGDEEPSSLVVHAGPFDWEAIRYGEADVAAWCDYDDWHDAELIVAMRNNWVPLLDRLEAAEAKIARVEALADEWDEAKNLGTSQPNVVARAFASSLRAALAGDPR